MLVSIQDLRSIQERCEIGELVQRLDVSIDRLTVIWDTDTGSLRRIFKNLKQAISTRVDSFEIHDNVRDDVFTLAKDFNEYDSINIIFFQLSTYGGEQLIRIDFNPNTLKEFDGMKIMFVADFQFDTRQEFNKKALNDVIDKMNNTEKDILLLGGDYTNWEGKIIPFFEEFKKVKRPEYGIYSVTGNHDYSNHDLVLKELENLKISNLDNGQLILKKNKKYI